MNLLVGAGLGILVKLLDDVASYIILKLLSQGPLLIFFPKHHDAGFVEKVFFAPIREELGFRFLPWLCTLLLSGENVIVTSAVVMYSAIVFADGHFYFPSPRINLIYFSGVGIILFAIFLKFGLPAVILTHIIHNLLCYLVEVRYIPRFNTAI